MIHPSLKSRILLLTCLIGSILILVISFLAINNYKTHIKQIFAEQGKIKANLMSENILMHLEFVSEINTLEAKFENFSAYPVILQCIMYDEKGKPLARYKKYSSDSWYNGSIRQNGVFFQKGRMLIYHPVKSVDDFYGTLLLIENTDELSRQISSFSIITFLIALSLILIIYFVTNRIEKQISKPLVELLKKTEVDPQNRTDKFSFNSLHDIQVLEDRFNELLDSIETGKIEKTEIEKKFQSSIIQLNESRKYTINLMENLSREIDKKNEALDLLNETQIRFDLAVNGSNDGLWDWQLQNKDKQWWSPRFYKILHYKESEIISSRTAFVKLIHPDDVKKEQNMLSEHLTDNSIYDVQLRLKSGRGNYDWYRIKGQALWNENKQPIRISGSLQDISEQQKIKSNLNIYIKNLELLSDLMQKINRSKNAREICKRLGTVAYDLVPDSFVLVTLYDPEIKCITHQADFGINDKINDVSRILGWNFRDLKLPVDFEFAKEVIPKTGKTYLTQIETGIYDLLGRTVSQTVCRILLKFLKIEAVFHIGFGIQGNSTGGVIIFSKTAKIPEKKQLLETLVNYSSMVIERHYVNQALSKEQQRLNLAIESGEIGMWDWNIETDQVSYNKYWLSMLGYKQNDFTGVRQVWENLLHPKDKPRAEQILNDYLNDKRDNYQVEFRLKSKEGHYKWIRAQGQKIINPDTNKPQKIIGSHIDIDNLKKSQEQIFQLNQELESRVSQRTAELEKSVAELEEFSYTISHDLRAPLRAIAGYTEILKEDQIDDFSEESLELINSITRNIKLMGNLIDDLLYYVHLNKIPVKPEELDIALIAWNAYNQLPTSINKQNINLTISDLTPAWGNQNQIRLLITHLLDNAIKYQKPDDNLEIVIGEKTIKNKNYYFLKDNGIGFNMEHANHIFKIFHRLHGIEKYEGTGVGLALVKRIIDKHNGDIFAESSPGEGATFYFNLNDFL